MGRRVSNGVVGSGNSIGTLSVTGSTITTTVSNGDLTIDPNGTGIVKFVNDLQLQAQGDVRFGDADSSNYVGFQGPATVATNVLWTLPATDGSVGQAMVTNGSGTLSWAIPAAAVVATTTNATFYPVFNSATTGNFSTPNVATALNFNASTGVLTSTAFTESSSIALKENFNPITNGLDAILSLQGWIYDRKDGSIKNEAGLIAEDVYNVIPNVVSLDENGKPAGINYSRLSAYLIEAVKSLKQEIASLKG